MSPRTAANAKFHSMGNRVQQERDRELVVRLCGEIGIDGYQTLSATDRIFIDDIRQKLNTKHQMFGRRQVAHIIDLHAEVINAKGR